MHVLPRKEAQRTSPSLLNENLCNQLLDSSIQLLATETSHFRGHTHCNLSSTCQGSLDCDSCTMWRGAWVRGYYIYLLANETKGWCQYLFLLIGLAGLCNCRSMHVGASLNFTVGVSFLCMWAVEPHTHVIIEFYLQCVLPEVGVVIVHVGLDRGTKSLC